LQKYINKKENKKRKEKKGHICGNNIFYRRPHFRNIEACPNRICKD
jgi:hypothetical protein